MGLRALLRTAIWAMLPLTLSGCDLLMAAMYPEFDPFVPEPFEQPGAETVYEAGRATLEITQGDTRQTIVLDELSTGSELWDFGATAIWRNEDGWALTVSAFSDPTFGSDPMGDVTIQRVNGMDLWTIDYMESTSHCLVQVAEVSEQRMTGTAECAGVRWTDGLGGFGGFGKPRYVENQERFSVDITFEAVPAGETVHS